MSGVDRDKYAAEGFFVVLRVLAVAAIARRVGVDVGDGIALSRGDAGQLAADLRGSFARCRGLLNRLSGNERCELGVVSAVDVHFLLPPWLCQGRWRANFDREKVRLFSRGFDKC